MIATSFDRRLHRVSVMKWTKRLTLLTLRGMLLADSDYSLSVLRMSHACHVAHKYTNVFETVEGVETYVAD